MELLTEMSTGFTDASGLWSAECLECHCHLLSTVLKHSGCVTSHVQMPPFVSFMDTDVPNLIKIMSCFEWLYK